MVRIGVSCARLLAFRVLNMQDSLNVKKRSTAKYSDVYHLIVTFLLLPLQSEKSRVYYFVSRLIRFIQGFIQGMYIFVIKVIQLI